MLISLFITCYNDTLFPQTGKAVVNVLERLGHSVEFRSDQTCCGQMHYNTGYQQDALSMMLHFLKIFDDAEIICVPSASCVGMVRDHFSKLAENLNNPTISRAVEDLVTRIFEFSELVVDKLGITDVGAVFRHSVTYHPSCHSLRSLHLGDKPVQLLRAVRGLTLIDLAEIDQCCGFGGTFALKNADVSTAMLSDKIRCVLETGAEFCVAADNSCLMQIAGGLGRKGSPIRCMHIAEILASTESKAEK